MTVLRQDVTKFTHPSGTVGNEATGGLAMQTGAVLTGLVSLAIVQLSYISYLVVTRRCESGRHRHRHWRRRRHDRL